MWYFRRVKAKSHFLSRIVYYVIMRSLIILYNFFYCKPDWASNCQKEWCFMWQCSEYLRTANVKLREQSVCWCYRPWYQTRTPDRHTTEIPAAMFIRTIQSTLYGSRIAGGSIIKAAAQPAESNCWLVQSDKNDWLFAWQQSTVSNTPSEELSPVGVHWDCVLMCATVVVPSEGQIDQQNRLKGNVALHVPLKYMEWSKKL